MWHCSIATKRCGLADRDPHLFLLLSLHYGSDLLQQSVLVDQHEGCCRGVVWVWPQVGYNRLTSELPAVLLFELSGLMVDTLSLLS